eukprot:1159874-Pelagomonas_calceolata.AAC.6
MHAAVGPRPNTLSWGLPATCAAGSLEACLVLPASAGCPPGPAAALWASTLPRAWNRGVKRWRVTWCSRLAATHALASAWQQKYEQRQRA